MISHADDGTGSASVSIDMKSRSVPFVTLNGGAEKKRSCFIKPANEFRAQIGKSIGLLPNDSLILISILDYP